jgi:hypothetical protein
LPPVTRNLVIANIAIFLVEMAVGDALRGAKAFQRLLPRQLQAIRSPRAHRSGTLIQVAGDLPAEIVVSSCHSFIPLAASISARACTAREQWVLTLPSEHPIAAAVSATSSSSQ